MFLLIFTIKIDEDCQVYEHISSSKLGGNKKIHFDIPADISVCMLFGE